METTVLVKACIPVIPSSDLEKSLPEFFVTDDDGYSHCFGVATDKMS
jgi:hypothetical protein